VQPFHLQRAEQRLRAGVVPAVSFAAHRGRDRILFEHFVEVVAGVLAAAIAMEDQLVVLIGTALEPGHLQCVDDQAAPPIGLHRPAHNTATEQIDHYSKKQPAFVGRNVRDVAGPRLVRHGRGEVGIQKVWRNRQIVPAVGGGDAKAVENGGRDSSRGHSGCVVDHTEITLLITGLLTIAQVVISALTVIQQHCGPNRKILLFP